MTFRHFIVFFIWLLINPTAKAQNNHDLGSTKPFLIGLKGTIYKYTFPKYLQLNVKIGYTTAIEKENPVRLCILSIQKS